jgi:hypothetical protein
MLEAVRFAVEVNSTAAAVSMVVAASTAAGTGNGIRSLKIRTAGSRVLPAVFLF